MITAFDVVELNISDYKCVIWNSFPKSGHAAILVTALVFHKSEDQQNNLIYFSQS